MQFVPYEVDETDRKSLVFLAEENKGKVLNGEMGGEISMYKILYLANPETCMPRSDSKLLS